MCHFFFKKRDSAVTTGKHRAQEIDRETALQTSQSEETNRIHSPSPTIHKILQSKMSFSKNCKILRNDHETKHKFPLPPLNSFKRDKNIGNFLVRRAFKSNNQLGTFKCKPTWCKTCPFTLSIRLSHRPLFMHLRKSDPLHNLHAMWKDLHGRNREKIGGPLSRTTGPSTF